MADAVNNKPKMQLRTTLPFINGEKSPSPATKLLISHGKPNFTLPRHGKHENGNGTKSPSPSPSTSPTPTLQSNGNNNYNPYKYASSYQNKVNNNINSIVGGPLAFVKPSAQQQQQQAKIESEFEANKVVLRRTKLGETAPQPKDEVDNGQVPEFIQRQRRIQERLAKDGLDFENRRSGYFTHVLISPDSPNRTSFVETMASPAIVPALELPHPQQQQQQQPQPQQQQQPAVIIEEQAHELEEGQKDDEAFAAEASKEEAKKVAEVEVEAQVAEAIRQVNQAIRDVNSVSDTLEEHEPEASKEKPETEEEPKEHEAKDSAEKSVESVAVSEPDVVKPTEHLVEHVTPEVIVTEVASEDADEKPKENEIKIPEKETATEPQQQNGHEPVTNGHDDGITVSHTNGFNDSGPSIPSPDPSGVRGVNYEPKTVVSFSQELGNGENKYPDSVKVIKEVTTEPNNGELEELSKLKFEINANAGDVQVTPILKSD